MAKTAAQLLDELMGRDRNLAPNEKRKEQNWDDPEVCKYFLCSFCPHELFTNTRADLGTCNKIHDDELRKKYQKSSRFERMGYEEEFVRFCQSLISDVERRIRRGHQRLQLNNQQGGFAATGQMAKEEKAQMLTERINELVENAEQLGCEGKVEEAQGVMKLCEQLREERANLDENAPAQVPALKEMEVCDICGAFLVVGDAKQRLDEHLMGKQHMGYAQVRAYLDKVQRKMRGEPDPEKEAQLKAEREEREKQREQEREERQKRLEEREKEREKEREERRKEREQRDKERKEKRDKDRHRSRSRERSRHRSRSKSKSSRRSRSRDRDRRDRDSRRHRSRSRDRHERGHRSRDGDRSSRSSRSSRRSRSKDRDRERKDKDRRSQDGSKDRSSRDKSKDRQDRTTQEEGEQAGEQTQVTEQQEGTPRENGQLHADGGDGIHSTGTEAGTTTWEAAEDSADHDMAGPEASFSAYPQDTSDIQQQQQSDAQGDSN